MSFVPGGGDDAGSSVGGAEKGGVGPGEIYGRYGDACGAVEVLGHRAILWSVFFNNAEVSVCVLSNGPRDGFVGQSGRVVGPRLNLGAEIAEEGETGWCDREGTELFPLVKSVVELFGGS